MTVKPKLMPPDSLVQVPGKIVDTIHAIKSQLVDSTHTVTNQPAAQPESKTWIDNYYYPVVTTLIAALLAFLVAKFWKRLVEVFTRKKIRLISITEATANEVSRNFIPNSYEVLESDNTPIERVEVNCMDYFLKKILRDEYSFYFISASTGVGKTTFLLNAYLHYKKRSKGYHSLYCGRAHDPVFRKTIDHLIQTEKAGETILLIDALDEFEIKAKSPEEYWKKFEASWDVYKVKLTHFKKVIVTVREQFLQFRSIEKVKITSGTGVSISRQIKLLPFVSESQRELYLDKRYAEKDITYREHLKWLAYKFEQKGLNFIHLPLILNFMEDIWTEYQKEKQKNIADPLENSNFFTLFNLLRIIEDAWLKREARNKGFDQQQIEMIRKFCIDLAYQMARSGRQTTISGKELIDFEKQKDVIRQFQGAGDRSLLVRKKGVTEQEDLYGFVHNYFLELFLIQHVLQQPETVNDISFLNFQFTIDVITRFQWDKIKKTPPPMPARTGRKYLELTAADFETLTAWFDLVYYNQEIRQLLENNNSVLQVIERQDPEWIQYLSHLDGLKITRANFWDNETEAPLPLSVKAIRLLKPFIREVSLDNIPLKDAHVIVFRGISSVGMLDLQDTEITIDGLSEFKLSAPELTYLDLYRLGLTDESLAFFQNAANLRFIYLNANSFTNNGIQYLNSSRDSVLELFIHGNSFDDEGIAFYDGVTQIKKLSISRNSIGAKGLQYFRNSFAQLDYLDISALPMVVESELLQLPDFENLECLFIAQNNYNGSCLKKFSKSVKTLGRLDLSKNEIDDAALEALRGVENIWALTLCNNPIKGSSLQIFEACSKKLEQIDLSNTLIGDDSLIHFLHTDKITHLDLSNLSITGKGLICFKNNHSALEDLYLSGNSSLTHDSLWVFQSFSNIKRLRLAGLRITSKELTNFIKSKATIKKIDIRNNPDITDLSFLLSCPNLAVLIVSNYEQFDEKQLEQLKEKRVNIIYEEDAIEEHFYRIWPESMA